MNEFIKEMLDLFKDLDVESLPKREALSLLHKIQTDLFKAVIKSN